MTIPKKPIVTKAIIEQFGQYPEFQRFLMDLGGLSSDKTNKVEDGTENNIPILDDEGDLKDSGQSLTDVEARAFFFARIY